MFKKNDNYQRRYNSILRIDAVDETVEHNAIDSYKPSKYSSIANTLLEDTLDSNSVLDSKSNSNYEYDMDLLEFASNTEATTENTLIDGVEVDCMDCDEVKPSESKNSNLLIVLGVVLGLIVTIIVNILM